MTEKSKAKPILGCTDTETVKLDFDGMSFKDVKYWALRVMKWFRLEGFIILKSSKNSYHVVFNRLVSWSENMRIVAWASLESGNKELVKYLQMQCIKESSTLRLSSKGDKPSPRIIYRYGKQGKQIEGFLRFRASVRGLSKKFDF